DRAQRRHVLSLPARLGTPRRPALSATFERRRRWVPASAVGAERSEAPGTWVGGGRCRLPGVLAPPSAAPAVDGLAADGVLVQALGEMETLADELDGGRDPGGRLAHAEVGERLAQPGQLRQERRVLGGGDILAGVHREALVERGDERRQTLGPAAGAEHLEHRRLDDALEHLLLAAVV